MSMAQSDSDSTTKTADWESVHARVLNASREHVVQAFSRSRNISRNGGDRRIFGAPFIHSTSGR